MNPPAYGAPPPQAYYPPMPQQQQSSSSNNNIVVVSGGAPAQTIVIEKRGVNHCLHFCISLFFFPWVIVWIILCITQK